MKVKVFSSWTENGLTNKMNNFIANEKIEVVDIKFSSTIFGFNAMILYR